MQTGSPIESLASALHAACLRDLPLIEYMDRDWDAYQALSQEEKRAIRQQERDTGQTHGPTLAKSRRPDPTDCEVVLFPQMWASTALGYGGAGGAAMTTAYTVIVRCTFTGWRAVYFGHHRLAYLIPPRAHQEEFEHCLVKQVMPSVRDAAQWGWTRLPSDSQTT